MHANNSIELRKQMNGFKKPETMKIFCLYNPCMVKNWIFSLTQQ